MELPCQCLSSLPTKHPSAVLSILSSAPLSFREQRIEVEKDDEEEQGGRSRCMELKKQQGEEGGWGRGGSAYVKGHSVLQLDKQALRGTNKIITANPPLWWPPHLTLYFVKWTIRCKRTTIFTSLMSPFSKQQLAKQHLQI